MKFTAIPVVLVLAFSSALAGGPVSFGISAGAVFSKPTLSEYGPSTFTDSRVTNATFGVLARVPLEGEVSLQFEPAFIRKGFAGSENVLGYVYGVSGSADYIELPVLLSVSFPAGILAPYVIVGPSLAYKVSETWDLSFAQGPPPYFYERYDVSLNAGGGLLLRAGERFSLVIQARYSFGLNQVNTSGSGALRSSEIRLGAGLLINL
jgi:hypothetical protein